MTDIKLFKLTNGVEELSAQTVLLEKQLQNLIEENMNVFFGVTFLKSEYVTSHGGRMDSLGIDENYCPVIFEYKRTMNENVINQGLFYLDWLLDHKAEFEILVMKQLGKEISDQLDWSMPRLICIANDFTKYDEYAVKQINRNIDLVRYKKFGEELILFELMNSNVVNQVKGNHSKTETFSIQEKNNDKKGFAQLLESASVPLQEIFEELKEYILDLGEDVTEHPLKFYVAFKKIKNIICVEIYQKGIVMHLKLNPDQFELEEGFTRDVRGIGHLGTGDLQVWIRSKEDFEKAKLYLQKAYEMN